MSQEQRSALEVLLELLDTEKAQYLLKDLRDDAKRTPQLYASIDKLLTRHAFTIKKLAVDAPVLGALDAALKEFQSMSFENPDESFH